ncbi:MAG TPA: pyridoxal phosphate-dependent aminotransferase [Planctomycetota bacterium]|nr:pyridoxal phosphate-dependent aminotransferase [Planctomycetota bacterium]
MGAHPPSGARELSFPYMLFARTEGMAAPYPLTQSGMTPPDAALLGEPEPPDLGFAGADALPRLQGRLAERFGVAPERVVVTLGASGAMAALALAWFRPGVRVASEVPSYDPLRALPRLLGADARLVRRRLDEGWRVDPAEVRRELAGAGPGHLFLTNPHNPSGAVLGAGELRELAAEAARAGGVLISNEIYMEYAPPERRVHAFRLAPNAVSIGSLTKAYGLGALRIGWIVLGEGLAEERLHLEDALWLAWVDPPTPALRLALRALDRMGELRARLEEIERASKPIFVRWLEAAEELEGTAPEHGLIAFPRVRGVEDTRALARHLARDHGVGVVPGEFFGAPGHLRLGFGLPPEGLREALERLQQGLRSFRKA